MKHLVNPGMKSIPYGHAMPGEMVIDVETAEWRGDYSWTCLHGEATSHWMYGKPVTLSNASVHGCGIRHDVKRADPETGLWCFLDEDGVWVHGEVKLGASDISFYPADRQPVERQWPKTSMAASLAASAQMMEAVKDDAFAFALYGSLCNNLWKQAGSGKEARFSWRKSAEVLSRLRGRCEPAREFLFVGTEGDIYSADVLDMVNEAGWEFDRALGTPETRAQRAARIVSECSSRKAAQMPDWFADFLMAYHVDRTGSDLVSAMNAAAFSGKVMIAEWDLFWENMPIEQ
jgi:hypothetical protein